MVKKIDFAAINDARKQLRQMVADNPNPTREIESMERLDDMTMGEAMPKPANQRLIEYRKRLKENGIRGMYVYISDTDRDRLERLAIKLDITMGECISYLLNDFESKTGRSNHNE